MFSLNGFKNTLLFSEICLFEKKWNFFSNHLSDFGLKMIKRSQILSSKIQSQDVEKQ
jgi:hypothetical protein